MHPLEPRLRTLSLPGSPCRLLAAVLFLLLAAPTGFGGMVLQGLSGPVTSTELSSFKTFMQGESPPSANTYDNNMADGTAGMDAEALGLVYEINHDSQLLDRMIQYSDAFLSLRNDTNSGVLMWDGSRDPVWLTKPPTNSDGSINPQAGYAGCENNDIAGHIAYCARLILQTPSLWNTPVAVGDPRHYGGTYLQRAQTYITQMDFTQDAYMLKWFIAPATSRLTAPTNAAWTAENENVNAWNRQMMFLNGFQRLSECHQLLGDNPARVAQYDAIVAAAVNWFFSALKPYTTNGYPVYNWTYSPTSGGSEDMTLHSTYDIWGSTRAYASGRYGISAATMIPFANTLQYVINIATNQVSYYVNGTGTARNFIYPGWMPIANFGPCTFGIMANMDSSRQASTAIYDAFILWVKNARYLGVYPVTCGGPDYAIVTPWVQTVIPGGNVTALVTLTSLSGFADDVSLSAANLPSGLTADFNPPSISGGSGTSTLTLSASSSTPTGIYSLGNGLTIVGTNAGGAIARTAPLTLVVSSAAAAALPPPWSDLDVGGPAIAGSASYSGGVFAVQGGGNDIWSASDQFHYVYQPVTGDLTVTAEVTSLQSSNAWSKAGVMVRETTNANSGYVGLYVTAANGVSMQFRPGAGSNSVDLARSNGLAAPYWVRLTRVGDTFTGWCSPDGVSWGQVRSTNLALAAVATVGLPVCSHDTTKLNYSTFANVSVAPADTDGDGIPDAWMLQYFSHPTGQAADRSRAGDDADGDGMSNLAEYLAGTNPTNAGSNLRFTSLRAAGNDLSLVWTVVGGKSYVLQAAPSLDNLSSFADISPEIIVPGAGESVTNYVDAGALTNVLRRFYRVRLGP